MTRRVVITAVGMVSPIGDACGEKTPCGKESYRDALLKGKSGLVAPPEHLFGPGKPEVNAVALVNSTEEDLVNLFGKQARKKLKVPGRAARLALHATHYALTDSGLLGTDLEDMSLHVAADQGALPFSSWAAVAGKTFAEQPAETVTPWSLVRECMRSLNPLWQLEVMTNGAAAIISELFQIHGPSNTSSSACTAGVNALWSGYRDIVDGTANKAVVVASDHRMNLWSIAGFRSLEALSTRECEPERASAPCDESRDGFVLGEGGGAVVIEELEHAKKRGANIYAEILGFGSTTGGSMTQTNPRYVAGAIQKACQHARINPSDIDMIAAHATGTKYGDPQEVCGIRQAFGADADKPGVYCPKGAIGHQIVAAPMMSFVATTLAVYLGVIPGNVNLERPDPCCKLNHIRRTVEKKIRHALVMALGFGGGNLAVILRAFN